MKSLEVTEEQYEELDAIREALAEDVRYGHVRPRDALQRLLDAHGDDTLDVPGAGDDSGTDVAEEPAESDETAEQDNDESADENETDGSSADDSATDGGGDDKLSAMMSLLDTHDDKWEKADSQETRYVVDLPDGGTEEVQTKDDVKAILFKKY